MSEVRRERNLLSFFVTLSVKETNRGKRKRDCSPRGRSKECVCVCRSVTVVFPVRNLASSVVAGANRPYLVLFSCVCVCVCVFVWLGFFFFVWHFVFFPPFLFFCFGFVVGMVAQW